MFPAVPTYGPAPDRALRMPAMRPAGILALLLIAVSAAHVRAQTPTPAATYTAQQADSGKVVYERSCASCHGAMQEGGEGPPLKGASFLYAWNGQSAPGLIRFVQSNMPMSAPGSLSEASATAVTAYLLSINGVKASSAPLNRATTAVVLVPPPSN
jgi:mono/diheme cytochrome c family protein